MKKTLLSIIGVLIWMMTVPHAVLAQDVGSKFGITSSVMDKQAITEQLRQRQPEVITPTWYTEQVMKKKAVSASEKPKPAKVAVNSVLQMMPMLRPEQVRHLAQRMQTKGLITPRQNAAPLRIKSSDGGSVVLWAYSYMSMSWYMSGDNYNPGLISIQLDDDINISDIYRRAQYIMGSSGMLLIDDTYYAFEKGKFIGDINIPPYTFYKLYKYDTTTWTGDQPTKEILASSLYPAYDSKSGLVYVLYTVGDVDGEVFSFGYFDLEKQQIYKICDTNITRNINNSAECTFLLTTDGRFYFADRDENLYSFNPETGEATLIGKTLSESLNSRAWAIDHSTDKIYMMTYDGAMQSGIYEINPETAEPTELGRIPFGHWVMSMDIPTQYHPADAPAKPENLSAHFENGQKEGTISFTLPQTTRKGETLSGNLHYSVMLDGKEVASGEGDTGETVTAGVTLSRDGFNAITVKANEGMEAHYYAYAGDDTPQAVAHVAISNNGHQTDLSWEASTEGVNGGYMNPEAVNYIVTRYPDSLVVGTVSGTTFTDHVNLEKPTVYHYGIKAVFNGKESDEALSEKVAISDGFTLPYHENFLADDIAYFYYAPLRGMYDLGWHIGWVLGNDEEKIGVAAADFSMPEWCDTDHWLYTPEFIMQPGVYNITLRIAPQYTKEYGFDASQLSIYFGKGLTPAAMEEILAPFSIELGYQRITANVLVEEAGNYRFALRCTSDTENGGGLWLEEYDIDGGANFSAPAAPQLALNAAPLGARAVDVSITAPTKNISGGELTNIDKIEIHRYDGLYIGGEEDVLIKTFDHPVPGETLTFTDTPFADGCFETYWAMAYNEAGRGVMTDGRLYVGQDVPLAPKNPDVWADEVPHLTWEAPEGTLYGGYADLDNLTYNIYSADPLWGELYMVADGVSGMSYDDPSADMAGGNTEFGDQYPLYYAIAAVNGKYLSNESFTYTWPVLVGTPYKLPLLESFINSNMGRIEWKYQWVERVREGGWNYGYGEKMTRDGDDLRCWVMGGYGSMELTSGRITLKGSVKPRLLYSYYQLPGQSNRLEAKIVLHDGTEKIVGTHDFATMQGGMKWMTQEVDLSEYASEDWVMLRFSCYGDNLQEYVLLDDIRVFDLVEKNLSIKGMTVPELIRLGKPKHIQAYITNTGSQTATGYHVNLYVNDKLEASIAGPSIESLANATIELPYDPRPDAPRNSNARVEIAWDDDQIAEDNASDTKRFLVMNNTLAIVTDLAAEENEDGTIGLGWSEPVNEHDYTFTEDFENSYYDAGDTEYIGYWKLIDRDGGYTKMINGINWSTAGDPASFIVYLPNVWGVTGLSNDPVWGTYSGVRCAISMGTIPEVGIQGNDDWMISTELTGEAQTISLWAKSLDDHFGNAESFEVLYSTTGREVEDFTSAATYRDISAVWTKYEVALPAGAKYLAIRNIGKNRNMLSIDDIVMRVAGQKPLQYVIWRNGEPTDTISAEQTVYTDRVKENGDYTYQIQVLYEEGPSRLSNAAMVTATNGITEMSRGALRVGSHPGFIEVYEAEGERVEIYTPDGRRVYTGTGRRYLSVAVQHGTYIVRIGGKATKIIVR